MAESVGYFRIRAIYPGERIAKPRGWPGVHFATLSCAARGIDRETRTRVPSGLLTRSVLARQAVRESGYKAGEASLQKETALQSAAKRAFDHGGSLNQALALRTRFVSTATVLG